MRYINLRLTYLLTYLLTHMGHQSMEDAVSPYRNNAGCYNDCVVNAGRSVGRVGLEASPRRRVSSADLPTSACGTDWSRHSDLPVYVHRYR